MQRQSRYQFLRCPDHAHILYNDSIDSHIMQKNQIILQFRQLLVIHQRIDRHIQTDMVHVAEVNRLFHLFPVKIAGIGPGPKRFSSQIYRIRPGVYRSFQRFPRTCGSK